MATAAAPKYLGNDFHMASPGLRFGMYFRVWGINNRTSENLWGTDDINFRPTRRERREREFKDSNKTAALDEVTKLTPEDITLTKQLNDRQNSLCQLIPEKSRYRLQGQSIAPFATGLGNEHPLENGFSFLNPYGLPYLPGSGVKGVVRRAAEELAHRDFWGSNSEWTLPDIWRLFGFEPWPKASKKNDKQEWEKFVSGFDVSSEEIENYLADNLDKDSIIYKDVGGKIGQGEFGLLELMEERKLHIRGALSFWDVIPQIKGGKLAIEVMTPHQKLYYQKKESPHDSGQPTPIGFLAIPPESEFTFHVTCDFSRLNGDLRHDETWKKLLEAAFDHAFDWLGFGAKTSVGYGALKRDIQREQEELEDRKKRDEARQAEEQRKQKLAEMTPIERSIQEVLDTRRGNEEEIVTILNAVKSGKWDGDEKIDVAKWLKSKMRDKKEWREQSNKKNPDRDRPFQRTRLVKEWLEDH